MTSSLPVTPANQRSADAARDGLLSRFGNPLSSLAYKILFAPHPTFFRTPSWLEVHRVFWTVAGPLLESLAGCVHLYAHRRPLTFV